MIRAFFLLVASLAATACWAGRPLATEDAGVLERGDCEIELAYDRSADGASRSHESSAQMACGVGSATQLSVAVALADDGGASRTVAMGGKTRLAGADDDPRGAWVLAYALASRKVTGAGWRTDAAALNLVHSRPIANDRLLHLNLGHVREVAARRGATNYGIGFEQGGLGALVPVAELQGDDRGAPWWGLGLRADLMNGQLVLAAGIGRQIHSAGPSRGSVSAKLSF